MHEMYAGKAISNRHESHIFTASNDTVFFQKTTFSIFRKRLLYMFLTIS